MHLCLFADVYGFGSRIGAGTSDLAAQLSSFHQRLDLIVTRRTTSLNVNYLAASDSIFVVHELREPSGFEAFITLTIEIYSASLDADLPLRGCITAGDLQVTERAFLGVPALEAVAFEKRAHLPLIYVPAFTITNLSTRGCLSEREMLRIVGEMRDVPLADGITRGSPLIPNPPKRLAKLARANYLALASSSSFLDVTRAAKAWRDVEALVSS